MAAPPSAAMLRKAAHYRLAERFDPAKNRHKPLSLLRAEARRLLDQFLEREAVLMAKAERDRFAEDVLASSLLFGPLEELFRDPTVGEIQLLPGGALIAVKGGAWLPANGRFRDDAQVRAVLAYYAETGEGTGLASQAGGFDVKLSNGWRALAVIPPAELEHPATAAIVRAGAVSAAPAPTAPARPAPVAPTAAALAGPGSSIIPGMLGLPDDPGASGSRTGPPSGARGSGASLPMPPSGTSLRSGPNEPRAQLRQRVTERLIRQLAAAGVYDLKRIPIHELRKIVQAYVAEQCEFDHSPLDANAQDEVVVEILTAMSR